MHSDPNFQSGSRDENVAGLGRETLPFTCSTGGPSRPGKFRSGAWGDFGPRHSSATTCTEVASEAGKGGPLRGESQAKDKAMDTLHV